MDFTDYRPGPNQTTLIFDLEDPLVVDNDKLRTELEPYFGALNDETWLSLQTELSRQKIVFAAHGGRRFVALAG